MVLTEDVLFLAGPPDVVPEEDSYAAFEGRVGAKLWALSPQDGEQLYEWPLESLPVFDGMSAAHGRLFIAQADGTVISMVNGLEYERKRADDD